MIPQFPLRSQAEGPLRRRSRRYPGLVLDLDPPFLTFRRGRAFEVYKLEAGAPRLVVCSPRGYGGRAMREHTRTVATAYAEALEADLARVRARLANLQHATAGR